MAYGLGAELTTFSFVFALGGRWGEEKVGVIPTAKGNRLPRTVHRRHRLLLKSGDKHSGRWTVDT